MPIEENALAGSRVSRGKQLAYLLQKDIDAAHKRLFPDHDPDVFLCAQDPCPLVHEDPVCDKCGGRSDG